MHLYIKLLFKGEKKEEKNKNTNQPPNMNKKIFFSGQGKAVSAASLLKWIKALLRAEDKSVAPALTKRETLLRAKRQQEW